MAIPLLKVEDLTISLHASGPRPIDIVDRVSFEIHAGEPVGVVGESGSGKSMIALAILGLLPKALKIRRGRIWFEGQEISSFDQIALENIRGRNISMIFQEPATALNPVLTTGQQIVEVIRRHEATSAAEAKERVIELYRQVGIPSASARFNDYPHQMSGGMRQRVMIAMAMSCRPKLIIADEPTTALDATIQRQIMSVLGRLQAETGVSILFISHNLALVSGFVERLLVMYAGRLSESGYTREVFGDSAHPYTDGLVQCATGLETSSGRLPTITGQVPTPLNFPVGCRFSTRCSYVRDICRDNVPPLYNVNSAHRSACFRHVDFELRPS